ncbi:alpha/beta fold hydrolase [Actinoplanes sp. NPDC051494]|uniref:alpha/beta fold hydrolase n=1 Tax=Actinoplanes sp. NPDC051494 TaxID=3363907 RepID=UPI00379DE816
MAASTVSENQLLCGMLGRRAVRVGIGGLRSRHMHARQESTHEVRVGDISLLCHIRGRGPICVAHPGGPGMHWEYLRMPLVERDLTMVYLEPVGTGGSDRLPAGTGYDLATYTGHLAAVADAFTAGPVFVLGHGHGGFVAQSLALRLPQRVAGLILYATAPLADERTRAAAVDCLRTRAGEQIVAAYDRRPGDDVRQETGRLREILPAYFADHRRREPAFEALRAAARRWPRPVAEFDPVFDVRAELPSLSTPALVLAGAYDFAFGPGAAAMFRPVLPGATVRVFRESGHFPHVEEPERFARVVRDFTGSASAHRPAGW